MLGDPLDSFDPFWTDPTEFEDPFSYEAWPSNALANPFQSARGMFNSEPGIGESNHRLLEREALLPQHVEEQSQIVT